VVAAKCCSEMLALRKFQENVLDVFRGIYFGWGEEEKLMRVTWEELSMEGFVMEK